MNPLFYKLGSVVVLLETVAAWLLVSRSDVDLLLFWAVHGTASVLVGLLLWTLLPTDLRRPKRLSLSLLTLLALFFPIVGVFGLLIAARLAQWLPMRHQATDHLREAPALQVFAVSHIDDDRRRDLPAGQTARIARDQSQPQAQRIRAVLALRDMSPRMALPVLRKLLSDPDEEIRLLAYGISNTWEQRLTDSLQDALREFEATRHAADHGAALARSAQRVAEMQMEFIYQGLAQGDLRDFALQQALHYCTLARDALPQDTGLQMMFLRLSLAAGKTEAARGVLEHLGAEGASPTLWRPYAAELEWNLRQFGQIAKVLQPLGALQVAPRLRPVVRVWQTESTPRSGPVISDAPAVQRPGSAPRPAEPAPMPAPLSDADRLLLG
ncbi:MAG: HEAT repeat domain-containing protein [Thiomonas sp.]